MARPLNALIWSYTPRGIPFQWLLDDFASSGMAEGSVERAAALVSWQYADDFLADVVGYTTWNGSTPTLQRITPMPHPFRDGFWVDEYELADFGAYETRSDFNDPLNNNAPVQDWCIYKLTFRRPKWHVRSDFTLAALFNNLEQNRYCTETLMPRPRERKVSGYGFEYDDSQAGQGADPTAWKVIPDERQFIPDYQIDIEVNWKQVPIAALPLDKIEAALNTVNKDPIRFVTEGRIWKPAELLFKGLSRPIEQYTGADDELYYDLHYRFTMQPGTWNKYLARDKTNPDVTSYKPISIRQLNKKGELVHPDPANNVPIIPPYRLSDFQKLFQPGNLA